MSQRSSGVPRCPHCGSVLIATTMTQAVRQALSGGPATMERIKEAARHIKPDATDKEIYNVLGSLIRRKQAHKISHDLYCQVLRGIV